MCRYCKNAKTGDDWVDLLNTGIFISSGEIGKVKILDAVVGIDTVHSLTLKIIGSEMADYGVTVPIKYCPMCGTNLKELEISKED